MLDKCVELANKDAGKSLESLIQKQKHCEEEIARLTREIKRIIDVFKQEDLVSDDLKNEYKGLLAERERLQTLNEKL